MNSSSDRAPLGVIAGSTFLDGAGLPPGGTRVVSTARGDVTVRTGNGFVLIRRHGVERYAPPHRIAHHAHVLALEELGARHVVGLASTGSLHAGLQPGTIVVPDDYLSMHPPPTFAEHEYLHIVPALDEGLRTLLLRAAREAGAPLVRDGGVYVQTHGPRFETAAEVRMIAAHGDVVGMTAASEATLVQERGGSYAMLCTVDNYANGVGATALTVAAFQAQLAAGRDPASRILEGLLRLWPTRPSSPEAP